ncbi:amino acid transporter [Beauveria bassiana ARSEF 2860]|uniref:Amino acid transporter n=1 Tax=Beauveria bassiana (strain ARSEF 2860) TaxID=655819 RepID=J4WC58_BEAB2|nr:amino acid transporter [Beauveria bassiana ARSEF 2860]EJP67665.1 amino acid transporter [Beauveria bassiana ARSEF 2860]
MPVDSIENKPVFELGLSRQEKGDPSLAKEFRNLDNYMEKSPRPATAGNVEAQPDDANVSGSASWNEALNKELQEGFTSADRADMQRMGKKQQFRRNFRLMSTIGFTTCVMGTWEILLT